MNLHERDDQQTHSKPKTVPMIIAPDVMIVHPLNLSILSPLMISVSTLLSPAHSAWMSKRLIYTTNMTHVSNCTHRI